MWRTKSCGIRFQLYTYFWPMLILCAAVCAFMLALTLFSLYPTCSVRTTKNLLAKGTKVILSKHKERARVVSRWFVSFYPVVHRDKTTSRVLILWLHGHVCTSPTGSILQAVPEPFSGRPRQCDSLVQQVLSMQPTGTLVYYDRCLTRCMKFSRVIFDKAATSKDVF